MRICTNCHTEQPDDQFRPLYRRRLWTKWCATCRKIRRLWYEQSEEPKTKGAA